MRAGSEEDIKELIKLIDKGKATTAAIFFQNNAGSP